MSQPNITVRLLDSNAVKLNKSIIDLDIIFSGTMDACNNFCNMFCGYKFISDPKNIFGGYYSNEDTGDCMLLV